MRTVAAVTLLVLLLAPLAAGQGEPRLEDLSGQELNARGLHVLVYHPYPDPQGDTWGIPEASANTSTGYMEAAYGAYWYPTTVFDGIERVEGATGFLETYNAYHELYLQRRVQDSPLRLLVHGAIVDDVATVTVKAQAKDDVPSTSIDLRLVLYEDEIAFDGGNGVDTHRFVVRHVLHAGAFALNSTGAGQMRLDAPLAPEWDTDHLGVVAALFNRDASSGSYRPGEVLQATSYRFDQPGPTIQDRRGVLLETLSATWCDACVYGDGAVDELANEYGIASSSFLQAGPHYLRAARPALPDLTTGTWETGLLVLALGAFLVGFTLDLSRLPDARREQAVRRSLLIGTGALTVALVLLLVYFLATNLGIEYVFSYTRRDYPWYYRMAGLWAGQKGTLLIWAAATGLFGLWFLRRGTRAAHRGALPADAPATLRVTRRVLLLILAALTWATLVARTFAPTSDYLLQFRPDGNGLQPVLLTPFMIIHPPIQFLSYALTGILFSVGLAHVATGGASWARLARPWARLNWLLATIGLGLGGLWAYYVLNFGGFWAWDPVETANLLAWFPLTLLLHAFIGYERGQHRTIAPFFALLALPMALFSTVATRTGLWVSVHAFTDPTKNFARDALVRLLNILETSELLRTLTALLVLSVLAPFVAVALGRVRTLDPRRRRAWTALAVAGAASAALALLADVVGVLGALFQASHALTLGTSAPIGLLVLAFAAVAVVLLTGPEPAQAPRAAPGWRRWVEAGPLVTLGILLLGLAFLAIFLLDVAGVNGYDRRLFDERAPFVALPIFLVLAAHFLRGLHGPRIALAAPLGTLAVTGLLVLGLPGHTAVLLVVPALLLVAVVSLLKLVDVASSPGPATPRQRVTSLCLILGALAAMVQWGNPPSQFLGLRVSWAWAVPAFAFASVALLAGALHAGRAHATWARIGASLLLPLGGPFGLATAAGLVALATARGPATSSSLQAALADRRAALRKSTVYLLHFGLAIGLCGYALATYESLATEPFQIGGGAPAVQGYTFEPIDASFQGRDAVQDLPREVHARVRILHEGDPLQEATLVYWLVPDGTPGHYDARVTVVRLATRDLYLFPTAIELRGQTLTDHVNGATPTDPTLEGVQLSLKVLPGAGLVWTGLWILGLSMTARLFFGGFEIGAAAPAAREAKRPLASEPVPAVPAAATEARP